MRFPAGFRKPFLEQRDCCIPAIHFEVSQGPSISVLRREPFRLNKPQFAFFGQLAEADGRLLSEMLDLTGIFMKALSLQPHFILVVGFHAVDAQQANPNTTPTGRVYIKGISIDDAVQAHRFPGLYGRSAGSIPLPCIFQYQDQTDRDENRPNGPESLDGCHAVRVV